MIKIESYIAGRHKHEKYKVKPMIFYKVITDPKNKFSRIACRVVKGNKERQYTIGHVPETKQPLAQILFPFLKKKLIEVTCQITTTETEMKGYQKGQGLILPCKYIIHWRYNDNKTILQEKELFLNQLNKLDILYEEIEEPIVESKPQALTTDNSILEGFHEALETLNEELKQPLSR